MMGSNEGTYIQSDFQFIRDIETFINALVKSETYLQNQYPDMFFELNCINIVITNLNLLKQNLIQNPTPTTLDVTKKEFEKYLLAENDLNHFHGLLKEAIESQFSPLCNKICTLFKDEFISLQEENPESLKTPVNKLIFHFSNKEFEKLNAIILILWNRFKETLNQLKQLNQELENLSFSQSDDDSIVKKMMLDIKNESEEPVLHQEEISLNLEDYPLIRPEHCFFDQQSSFFLSNKTDDEQYPPAKKKYSHQQEYSSKLIATRSEENLFSAAENVSSNKLSEKKDDHSITASMSEGFSITGCRITRKKEDYSLGRDKILDKSYSKKNKKRNSEPPKKNTLSSPRKKNTEISSEVSIVIPAEQGPREENKIDKKTSKSSSPNKSPVVNQGPSRKNSSKRNPEFLAGTAGVDDIPKLGRISKSSSPNKSPRGESSSRSPRRKNKNSEVAVSISKVTLFSGDENKDLGSKELPSQHPKTLMQSQDDSV